MKRKLINTIALLMAVLMIISMQTVSVFAADVTSPVLEGITSDKTLLSVGETVTYTATISDESYVSLAYITYERPSGISETVTLNKIGESNTYKGELTVDEQTESGVWNVEYITIIDKFDNTTTVANYPSYTYGEVKQDLSHLSFEVIGTNADTEPPVLVSIGIDKTLVSLGETITFTAELDEANPKSYFYLSYERPSGVSETITLDRIGNSNNYEGKFVVKEQTVSGVWNVEYISIYDKNDNSTVIANYPSYKYGNIKQDLSYLSFEVVGTNADVDPPILLSFEIDKTLVSLGETITFTAELDEANPKSYIYISYDRPSEVSETVVLNRVGNSNTYEGKFTVDEETVVGKWTAQYISMEDKNGNSTTIAHYPSNNYGTVKQDLSYLDFEVDEMISGDSSSHIVIFKDGFGATLSTQRVINGEAATEPAIPTNELYLFSGWDSDFSSVTSDMTVTAQWELKENIEYDFEVAVGETFEIEVYSTMPQTHTITCSDDVPFTWIHASTGTAFGDRVYWTNGYEITVDEAGSYIFYVNGSNTLAYKVRVFEKNNTEVPTKPSTGGNDVAPTEPLPTPPEVSTYEKGDANKDGRVNIIDATTIQKHLAQLITLDESNLVLADANGDGRVNILDATHIQKFLAQLIPNL